MSAAQEATADYGVARALSVARTIMDAGPLGLTKAEIRERVELYRSAKANGQTWESWDREFSRDKKHLRACGIDIQEPQADGEEYRYTISAADYGLPPLTLEPAERIALQRARTLFSGSRLRGLGHALWALESVAEIRGADGEQEPLPDPDPALQLSLGSEQELDQLVILAHMGTDRPLSFGYTAHGRRGVQQRRVVPLGLGARGHWYLIAHDLDRDQQRSFRLDRIQGTPVPLKPPFSADVQRAIDEIAAGTRYAQLDIRAVLEAFSAGQERHDGLQQIKRLHAEPAEVPRLRPLTAGRSSDPAETKIERVLNMAAYLLAHDGVPPSELLQKYGISPRQLQRDLLSLQQVGSFDRNYFADFITVSPLPPLSYEEFEQQYLPADAPIVLLDSSLDDSTPLARPVSLSKPGALALLIALQVVIDLGSEGQQSLSEAARSLRQKILTLVPEALAQSARSVTMTASRVDETVLTAAAQAIAEGTAADMEYQDAEGSISRRIIDPVQLVHDGPRSYLRAFCHTAGGERLFRLDRMRTLTVLAGSERSQAARELPLHQVPAARVPRTAESVDAVLRFAPSAAAEADAFAPQRHKIEDDGARVIATHYRSAAALIQLIFDAGGDIELLQPEALRERVRQRAESLIGRTIDA